MKKKISILSLSLIVSFTSLSGNVFAYKESDLKKLKETNKCFKCDLSGINFYMENLVGVNLKGSDLSKSNLAMSDLSESNLTEVNLNGAKLSRANLTGAILKGANFRGAKGVTLVKGLTDEQKKIIENQNIEWEKGAPARKTESLLAKKKSDEKKKNDDKKASLLAKKKSDEKGLSGLYNMYITLKTCYEVRKGQSYVYIQKTKMDEIKSYTKKIETKLLGEFPHLKSSKDKIWKDTSTKTTLNLRLLKSAEYDDGKQLCDLMDYTFTAMAESMFPPTGEVVEKDF